jgi:rSAM/selenodomain-associated transferase 2
MPALNEAEIIGTAIAAARRNHAEDEVEIIVVDGGSTDGTTERVPSRERLLRCRPGRAAQMNHGASAAQGDILVFCHADTRLPEGWRRPVISAMDQTGVSGGSFAIRLEPAQGILHLLNRLPVPADWRLMYGDQAQFTTRTTFERVGGFPDIPLMEDLEMMRRLARIGRLVRIPLRVTSSSRRFLNRGPLRQFCMNVSLVVRYLYLGAAAEEVARDYYAASCGRDHP